MGSVADTGKAGRVLELLPPSHSPHYLGRASGTKMPSGDQAALLYAFGKLREMEIGWGWLNAQRVEGRENQQHRPS